MPEPSIPHIGREWRSWPRQLLSCIYMTRYPQIAEMRGSFHLTYSTVRMVQSDQTESNSRDNYQGQAYTIVCNSKSALQAIDNPSPRPSQQIVHGDSRSHKEPKESKDRSGPC